MSLNFINQLPVELLTMCFDEMTIKEQVELMTVCEHWCNILSDGRYLQQHRFALYTENTYHPVPGVGLSVERMQRYRAFRISDHSIPFSQHIVYFQAVRAFLSREEVMSNVEDLVLSISREALCYLFENTQHYWYFPKLRRISAPNMDSNFIYINAPKLKQLKLVHDGDEPFTFVEKFCGQIEKLELIGVDSVTIHQVIRGKMFTNLQRLTLNIARLEVFYNFAVPRRQMLSQLKYLKIFGDLDIFPDFYKEIFQAAVNLETLIIIGGDMTADAFNAIQNMGQLKELCLLVKKMEHSTVKGLSLPKLEKLAVSHRSVVSLENVPKLKWLCIKNPHFISSHPACVGSTLQTTLRSIGQHIETLRLDCIFLNYSLLSDILLFKNFKFLEMYGVKVDMSHVWAILGEIPTIQGISISCCFMTSNYEEEEMFIEELKQQYPNKIIEHDIYGAMIDNLKRNSFWINDRFS